MVEQAAPLIVRIHADQAAPLLARYEELGRLARAAADEFKALDVDSPEADLAWEKYVAAQEERRSIRQALNPTIYAMEELVAEIGAAFLCARLGIDGEFRHPEYVAHWLGVLKGDKYAIFTASREAARAVDFILGEADEQEVEEEGSEEEAA